jgi:hypothetical protein
VGMITMLLRMAQAGDTVPASAGGGGIALGAVSAPPLRAGESALSVAAPLVLLVLTGVLGLFIPRFLDTALRQAALLWGG